MLDRLLELDRTLSARLTYRRAGFWRGLLSILAHTGDGVIWIAVGTALWLGGQRNLALREGLIVFGLIAIIAGLKILFRRRRPSTEGLQLYFKFDAHSFPSGHAARTAALAVVFGAFDPAWGAALGVWAVSVMLARVALGVHYLSDITVGALVGLVVGAAVIILT